MTEHNDSDADDATTMPDDHDTDYDSDASAQRAYNKMAAKAIETQDRSFSGITPIS